MHKLCPAVLVLLLSKAVLAQDSVTVTAAASTGQMTAPERVICRPITQDGQVVRTECHSQAAWDSIRQHNQQALRGVQTRAQQSIIHMGMTGLGHGH